MIPASHRIIGAARGGMRFLGRLLAERLETKIVVLVVLSVLAPSGVMWFATLKSTERFQTRYIEKKFNGALTMARLDIDRWYQDRVREIERLASSTALIDPLEHYFRSGSSRSIRKSDVNEYFALVAEKFPTYKRFVVVDDATGNVLSRHPLGGEELEQLKALLEGRSGATVSTVTFDPESQNALQWLGVAVELSGSRQVHVAVEMDLSALQEVLGTSPAGDVYVIDDQSRYITEPRLGAPPSSSGSVPTATVASNASTEGAEEAMGISHYTKHVRDETGSVRPLRYLGSKMYIPEREWWLVCEEEESSAIAPIVTSKLQILISDLLICAVFLVLAWRMSRRLLDPIRRLSVAARNMDNEGQGTGAESASGGEIDEMITAFNNMKDRIRTGKSTVEKLRGELKEREAALEETQSQLAMLSVKDALTGLYNHHHFWEIMDRELARADRYDGKFGLILLDIDNFKTVNDQFGHPTGDVLIQKVAAVLKETVRETDYIARYGGEEFAVLLPEASRDAVLHVSEKVRKAVEETVFKVPDTGITLSVTVSVGVSVFRRSHRAFFRAADNALHLSKTEGKNQVNFALAME